MRQQFLMMAIAISSFVGCASEAPAPEAETTMPDAAPAMPTPEALPGMITAERGGFIPEGVEYDTTHGRFLTGSLAEGSIFEIRPDGQVTAVVTDPELVSSVGIEVDESRNRLLVANSDRSVFEDASAGQAKLGVYNLTTGERVTMVDLAGAIDDPPDDAAYFANDVAVADDGTAYVTDTRMNLIYRVGLDYQASVLHRFDDFGPNGIVHPASGYLLVCGGASLWKVPLDDPAGATLVALPEEVLGQDGMVLTADGRLVIVSNSGNRVVAFTSEDDWATAQIAGVATYESQATTAAVAEGEVYVVHPHFADEDPPSLERVALE